MSSVKRLSPAPADDNKGIKRIRSMPHDVIVSVGSGESMQEFKCYKVMLSFASEYLDAMLSSGMKEEELGKISFPDKDPEEWKLFYEFISPQKIKKANFQADMSSKNVMTLLPWFHEFQMEEYVHECDECLANAHASDRYDGEDYGVLFNREGRDDESEADHQACLDKRKGTFDAILQVYLLACKYGLKSAKNATASMLALLINGDENSDLFDPSTVKSLLENILPIKMDAGGLLSSGGDCQILWTAFEKILSPHISSLSPDVFDGNVHLHLLVHSYMQIHFGEIKATRIKTSATKIISTFIEKYPDRMGLSSVNNHKFFNTLRRHYNHEHNREFKLLGIALPLPRRSF